MENKKEHNREINIFICFGVLLLLYFFTFFACYHFARAAMIAIMAAVTVIFAALLVLFDRRI